MASVSSNSTAVDGGGDALGRRVRFKDTSEEGTTTFQVASIKVVRDGEPVSLFPVAVLGSGAYGRVLRYAAAAPSSDGAVATATVKIETVRKRRIHKRVVVQENEHDLIPRLPRGHRQCGHIWARVLGRDNVFFRTDYSDPTRKSEVGGFEGAYTLLETMDGPVSVAVVREYADGLGLDAADAAVRIAEGIRVQMRCLLEAGFVYGDLKMSNVLYRRPSAGGKWVFKLGDLGSMLELPYDYETDAGRWTPMSFNCFYADSVLQEGTVKDLASAAASRQSLKVLCATFLLGIFVGRLCGMTAEAMAPLRHRGMINDPHAVKARKVLAIHDELVRRLGGSPDARRVARLLLGDVEVFGGSLLPPGGRRLVPEGTTYEWSSGARKLDARYTSPSLRVVVETRKDVVRAYTEREDADAMLWVTREGQRTVSALERYGEILQLLIDTDLVPEFPTVVFVVSKNNQKHYQSFLFEPVGTKEDGSVLLLHRFRRW